MYVSKNFNGNCNMHLSPCGNDPWSSPNWRQHQWHHPKWQCHISIDIMDRDASAIFIQLSGIYESPNNLEYLSDHFKTLRSDRGSPKAYDNTSLMVKTKMQDESIKHIISDFFQGEYKLLLEIDHQFQQLLQKKSKVGTGIMWHWIAGYFIGVLDAVRLGFGGIGVPFMWGGMVWAC